MKKLIFLLSAIALTSFIACGPSKEEQEKQKKQEDSLMEPERDAAIDNANKLLADTAIQEDSIKKEVKKSK